jgi:hypothetical protein
MLALFQNEWDSLALQTYTLQQNLQQTRQELSTALYENDAAVRVIAQLTKERDEARTALAQLNIGGAAPAGTNGDAMEVDSVPLPEPILERVENTKARYAPYTSCPGVVPLITRAAYQKRGGNGRYQRTGPRPSRFPPTPHSPRPNHSSPGGLYLRCIALARWLWWQALMAQAAWFLCQEMHWYTHCQ